MTEVSSRATPRVKGKVSLRGAAPGVKQAPKRKAHDSELDDSDEDQADSEGSDDDDNQDEIDTDDEIAAAKQSGKSKKTAKRKRRATSPTTFGSTLEQLLGSDTIEGSSKPSQQSNILSLAPHIRRSAQSSRLNAKAARLALEARKKREERSRVTDVIQGWGAPGELPKTLEGDEKPVGGQDGRDDEKIRAWLDQGGVQGYEKKLRKAAQRGVVKLFNAIRAAQNTNEDSLEDGGGAASLPADNKSGSKKGDNPLGGKAKAVNELSKNNFFDMIRAGTQRA